jgi:hypothetical protein
MVQALKKLALVMMTMTFIQTINNNINKNNEIEIPN